MMNKEHERGRNIMIGHIDEMNQINSNTKPRMRLYINLPFFFGKDAGNSLTLVNMMYSDVKIKLRLRPINELLYIEDGGKLDKPIKIKTHILGNYIYLSEDERRIASTMKTENLMERFTYGGTQIKSYKDFKESMVVDEGKAFNILKFKYYFKDPCRYIIWKMYIDRKDPEKKDMIYWDLGGYRIPNSDGSIDTTSKEVEIVKRVLITFDGRKREQWKGSEYYRYYQEYNKGVNGLDLGESFYSFALRPKELQPSGATNMTDIPNEEIHLEIDETFKSKMNTEGLKIRIMMWDCSHNLFVTMSGLSALRFY
jgi:hypothetical protein